MKREIISQILDALYEIRTKIFEEGDLCACTWMYEGLNQIAADLALMRAAWLPPSAEDNDQEPMELDIELPLEIEKGGEI